MTVTGLCLRPILCPFLQSAILASLLHRDRTGQGQRVDIPMFETMVGFVMGDHLGGLTFEPPLDQGGYARHMSPDRRPYQTSDGYISVKQNVERLVADNATEGALAPIADCRLRHATRDGQLDAGLAQSIGYGPRQVTCCKVATRAPQRPLPALRQ